MTQEGKEALARYSASQERIAELNKDGMISTAIEKTRQTQIEKEKDIAIAQEETKRSKEPTKQRYVFHAVQAIGIGLVGVVAWHNHGMGLGDLALALTAIFGPQYIEKLKDVVAEWRKSPAQ